VIDAREVRKKSFIKAKKLGFPINENLPFIEMGRLRNVSDIVNRTLALLAVVYVSYGVGRDHVVRWLNDELISEYLSGSENEYLFKSVGEDGFFNRQVECLNVFAWTMFLVRDISFNSCCSNDLVNKFPDVTKFESVEKFTKISKLREYEVVYEACDLAYCLHWAFSDNPGVIRTGNVEKYVVIERRRALDWLISDIEWDELSLDT
jgi:hypothetical protein